MNSDPRALISIVTPCYNEEASVESCVQAVRQVFEQELADCDYEHVFSDNCSSDRTVDILKALAAEDRRIKIVVNSRNFGPFRSMFNALRRTSGDAVITFLPVDLQDPPTLIPEFVKLWRSGYEIVAGARKTRAEPFLLRNARAVFYWILNRISDFEVPEKVGEFQLIDRRVVDAVLTYKDKYPFVRSLIASVGYRRVIVPYHWEKRQRGRSRLSLFNLVDQAMTGIFSFSTLPLRISILIGLAVAGSCFLYGLAVIVIALMGWSSAPPGVFTLIVGLFFLFGVQLTFFGIMGEYLMQIHRQVRGGEVVFERETVNFGQSGTGPSGTGPSGTGPSLPARPPAGEGEGEGVAAGGLR